MDAISNAELIELSFIATDHIYAQFQFWLSITFALIAACFIGRDQLSSRVRIVLGILYLVATSLLYIRILSAGANATRLTEEILARGINWTPESALWIGIYQAGVIVFGICTALWFLYSTSKRNGTKQTNQ